MSQINLDDILQTAMDLARRAGEVRCSSFALIFLMFSIKKLLYLLYLFLMFAIENSGSARVCALNYFDCILC